MLLPATVLSIKCETRCTAQQTPQSHGMVDRALHNEGA